MATAVPKITLSASRNIPVNKLVLSQSNVRRVKTAVSIEDLAEDIARRTLLQSLSVRGVLDAEGQETGMFEVPAGGRRYRALELLVKQKRMTKTQPVPCVVRTDGLAEEDSLAENVQRVALHALDQYRAFQTLRAKGLSEEEIAARFFVNPTVVKQRLKLAAVSEQLLDVHAEDGMTLEQLMAFTVTNDHVRQEQVWESLARAYNKEPYYIRRQLWPIATDVKAEKRFLSTIARRLDTPGAITKGQRQTGGQGLFRADDNLESVYARAALRELYLLLYTGKVEGCSLQAFEDATGLRLTAGDGSLREDLPPITTFLNRLLALTIHLQNTLFGAFEDLLRAKVEGAIASGTYDLGVETVTAEGLIVTDRRPLHVHPHSGAETQVFTIARRDRNRPFTLAEALDRANDPRARLLVNSQSGRAAVQMPVPSLMLDDGEVERRVRLLRPMERAAIPLSAMAQTHWREADRPDFARAWETELAAVPEFIDSILHIVAGLLLPIWKRLPNECMRVYRLQTDNGERVIGRLVSAAWVAQAAENDVPTLSPTDTLAALLDGLTVLQLQDEFELRRVKVMGKFRVELSGFTDGMVERLKAIGLISEIISWKLRLFAPTGASGPAILAKMKEWHPLVRIGDMAAA